MIGPRILRLCVLVAGVGGMLTLPFGGCLCVLPPQGGRDGGTVVPPQGTSGEVQGPPFDTGAAAGGGQAGATGLTGVAGVTELFDVGARVPGVVFNGELPGDHAGAALAGGADVDGDGRADFLIAAPDADPPDRPDGGIVYLIKGAARSDLPDRLELRDVGGAGGPASAKIFGRSTGERLGAALALVGDLEGDGRDDLLLGVPGAANGGGAYLIYGSNSFVGNVELDNLGAEGGLAGAVFPAEADGDGLGTSLAAGDTNGDQHTDLLLGAPNHDVNGGADAGQAYLINETGQITGNVSLTSVAVTLAGLKVTGRGTGFQAGWSVAVIPDLNGDALAEMAIGSPAADVNAADDGEAHVIFGRTVWVPIFSLADVGGARPGIQIIGEGQDDMFGTVVAPAGDISGDGREDLIVTAPTADPADVADAGAVYVVFGRDDLTGPINAADIGNTVAGVKFVGAAAGDQAGTGAAAGDVDGDGIGDLLIGAPLADPDGRADAGEAYLVFGSSHLSGVIKLADVGTTVPGVRFRGLSPGDQAGTAVVGVGDVDGDGKADLLIGAPNNDFRDDDSGQVYLIYGFDRP